MGRASVGSHRQKTPASAGTKVIYKFGGYRIDTARFEITRGGRALAVEPQVLELLIMLIDNRDRVVSKDELFGKIWKRRIVSDTTLSSRIKTARQVIGDTGSRQEYIKTIHGRGFRFVGNVEVETAAPPATGREPSKSTTADRPATRYARSGDIHVASDVLPSIQVPTLVIHVAGDVLIDVQAGRDLATHIPGAKYVELPGIDHLPMVGENPDRIIDAVAPFLEHPKRREESNRILATILLIQIGAKSAGGVSEKETQAVKEQLQRFRATRIASQPGGIAATFDGPARALECAVSLSRLLHGRNLDYQLAVHTGEVRLEAGTLEGTAMNIASDVADRARNEEILVSRTVNDLVAGSGIALKDRGEFALPSIKQAWRLFQVEV